MITTVEEAKRLFDEQRSEAAALRTADPIAFQFICEQRRLGRGRSREDRKLLLKEFYKLAN